MIYEENEQSAIVQKCPYQIISVRGATIDIKV